MPDAVPALRVKIPCADEGEFYGRFADHVAAKGLRFATEEQRPVGSRVRVALEFKNGETLSGEAVVDGHVHLDSGAGLSVRVLRLDRASRSVPSPRRVPPPTLSRPAASTSPEAAPPPLEHELFSDLAEAPAAGEPPAAMDVFTGSAEIATLVGRRAARVRRAAIAAALAAVVLAAGALLVRAVSPPFTRQAAAAAHVDAADRLLTAGRLTGEGGALEHLLAAKRLRPDDVATSARLERLADLLETLGARAIDRGDLAVASVHLEAARLASPARASIGAKLAAVARRTKAGERSRDPKSRR